MYAPSPSGGNPMAAPNGATAMGDQMRQLYTEKKQHMNQDTFLAYHLVAPRLNELKAQHQVNLILAIFALAFVSIQAVEFWVNQYPNECWDLAHNKTALFAPEDMNDVREECKGQTGAWGVLPFHLLEFWATFIFNIVEIMALFYSPKNLQTVFCSPTCLKIVVACNICFSLISATIITINMSKFEVWSHEIEYCDEIMLAIVDIILLLSLVRKARGMERTQKLNFAGNAAIVIIALGIALAQFYIYNFNGWGEGGSFPDGEPAGEKDSHDLEFAFSAISGFITFWFTMDNALIASQKMKKLYCGDLGNLGLADMDTELYGQGDDESEENSE
jgi:hypothetical protein